MDVMFMLMSDRYYFIVIYLIECFLYAMISDR
jgi:hypothetical protein